MPKRKWNLNTIYISERLQEGLRPISTAALTAVVAPMGYGKTTAVNWYLSERSKTAKIKVIRISVYSGNLMIFWKSMQDAFVHEGFDFMKDYPYPTDVAAAGLLADAMCRELEGDRECYIFIDDFHLMTDERMLDFICMISGRLPENVHLIIASRDRFLPSAEVLRLGSNVYQIGTEFLRLNHTELAVYAHRCGLALTESQIDDLLYSCEGWFSAIYLNLCTLYERGELPDQNSDIYDMFIAALIDPLSDPQRDFLSVMGLADEFTVEMAVFVTEDPDSKEILRTLTGQNAFVSRLPDGKSYRFHHMMKECAERVFSTRDKDKQDHYRNRFGLWYEEHDQYLNALKFYRQSKNFEAMLRVIRKDAGILVSSFDPKVILEMLEKCPVEALKENPLSILVLMRCMFNWRQIPKMMELKGILLNAIEEQPDMDPVEKGNLLGECDLIPSFLMYNDISAMSALHRSASSRMSRIAISITNRGGWTFGSPSVLMMFHREPGELAKELNEMDECMPHYYKITDGHGRGAEKIMSSETALMQGRFQDAKIALESAYNEIEESNQVNMALCCDFTERRLSLFTDTDRRKGFKERYEELLRHHNIAYLNIWNASCAYYYALLNDLNNVPETFRDHKLSTVNILAPGKPMHEMIENQVYLSEGAYAKVIGRSEGLLKMCEALHYGLVSLHLLIQSAGAYEKLGKKKEAKAMLKTALQKAMPDELLLPFAENYRYIKDTLKSFNKGKEAAFAGRIGELGAVIETRKGSGEKDIRPAALEVLTDREYEIVSLMGQRMSNREIAEKLFLSEGSVKQYVNQIYSKLRIEGDRRTKRQQLFAMLGNE